MLLLPSSLGSSLQLPFHSVVALATHNPAAAVARIQGSFGRQQPSIGEEHVPIGREQASIGRKQVYFGGERGPDDTGFFFTKPKELSVPCSRNMTCPACSLVPTLPASIFTHVVQNKHILFWGDSVTAQVECDLRAAVVEAGHVEPANQWSKGGDFPSINASTRFVQRGCPWNCAKGSYNETSNISALVQDAENATHVVFHLGHHYPTKNLADSVDRLYKPALLALRNAGKSVIVRSMNTVHFHTPQGTYDSKTYHNNEHSYVCYGHSPKVGEFSALDQVLRKLAVDTGALLLDISGLSDDPHSHAMYHDGKLVRDCTHVCSNCDMARSWNSLLLRYL